MTVSWKVYSDWVLIVASVLLLLEVVVVEQRYDYSYKPPRRNKQEEVCVSQRKNEKPKQSVLYPHSAKGTGGAAADRYDVK